VTILPSPIPHPLDYMPFDVPGWAYEAIEWVVGFQWPEGNEKETWDVADRWYALAAALVPPRDEAYQAADQVISGYGGAGVTIEAFEAAWKQVADGKDAPLVALIEIADALGKLVEECGCDIEGAKIEAWIELGIFLMELIAMAVTVALTLGAASPAAAGLIAATRMAIQQIFKRLIAQLSKKAIKAGLKEAGQRAAKQLTTKAGLRKLGKNAFKEGFEEAREEFATNLGIQLYQNSTGRKDGIDGAALGMSAAGGFAGGFAASGASIGGHGHGRMENVMRGAGGEVLGEMGGAALGGDLSLESLGKAATSGGLSSNMDHSKSVATGKIINNLSSLSGTPGGLGDASAPPGGTDGSGPSSTGNTTSGYAESSSPSSSPSGSPTSSSGSPSSSGLPSSGLPSSSSSSLSGSAASSFVGGTSSVLSGADGTANHAVAGVTSAAVDPGSSSSTGSTSGNGSPTSNGAPAGHPASAPTGSDAGSHSGSTSASASANSASSPAQSGSSVSSASSPSHSALNLSTVATEPPATAGPSTTGGPGPTGTGMQASAPASTGPASNGPAGTVLGNPLGNGPGNSGPVGPVATSSPGLATTSTAPPISTPLTGTSPTGTLPPITGTSPLASSPTTAASPLTGTSPTTGPQTGVTPTTGPQANPPHSQPATAPAQTGTPPAQTGAPSSTGPATGGNPAASVPPHGLAGGGPAAPTKPGPGSDAAPAQPATTSPAAAQPAAAQPDAAPDPASGFINTSPSPHRVAQEQKARDDYHDHSAQQRRQAVERVRNRAVGEKRRQAETHQKSAKRLRRMARIARFIRAKPHLADVLYVQADIEASNAAIAAHEADALAAAPPQTGTTMVDDADWGDANTDHGALAGGGILTSDISGLNGTGHPPPADATREYGEKSGLRRPLAQHQLDLERAVPLDGNGRPMRGVDPRHPYFQLLNDGGAQADPTRGINCQDCVLSFFDTYMHGRPRVSAPRTFDMYANGDPDKPGMGEKLGPTRVEAMTGGRLQQLCPDISGLPPAQGQQAVVSAFHELHGQLLAGGPGSFAFIINAWSGGSAHAWAAVNHGGQIFFVDPQSGAVDGPSVPGQPLRTLHPTGIMTMVDALVVDGNGRPMEFQNKPNGAWSTTPHVAPTPAPTPPPIPSPAPAPPVPAPSPAPAPAPAPDVVLNAAPAPGPHVDPTLQLSEARQPDPEPQPDKTRQPDPAPAPQPNPAPRPAPSPIPSPRRPVDRLADAFTPRPAPVDRIADALSPRPTLQQSPTPTPDLASDPNASTTPDRTPSPELQAMLDQSARDGHSGYAQHIRQTYEQNRRDDRVDFLRGLAEHHRNRARDLAADAIRAREAGSTLRAERLSQSSADEMQASYERDDEATAIRDGGLLPQQVEVEPYDWHRLNDDVGDLASGAVETDDRSALTGDDRPRPVDTTRSYGERGGLREPLAVHQQDLERAMPRDADGRVVRLADPRVGNWFKLANDGGPQADATRGINCVDGVLSLYETVLHGRPRVSAPRTFDSYANGDPTRPLGPERGGLSRIEMTAESQFQGLCPFVGGQDPAEAKRAVDQAMTNLHNQLHNAGHGSFAFIVTDAEGGNAHAWAAMNRNGTILYLDPQNGQISEDVPLYSHTGQAYDGNVVSMDALVVDGLGNPAPLPFHEAGLWSGRSLEPTGAESFDGPAESTSSDPAASDPDASDVADPADALVEAEETEAQAAEREILESLRPEDRAKLEASMDRSRTVADRALTELRDIAATLGKVDREDQPKVVDEKHRVKELTSLARKFAEKFQLEQVTADDFLAQAKDRVRFSVQVPEADYGRTVRSVLDSLVDRGYTVAGQASFWSGAGRHNGLNVNLVDAEGFRIEVQFPTEFSRTIGKETHHLYEIVRLMDETPTARVEAFLDILAVNKADDISAHLPTDLDALGKVRTIDTTFVAWTEQEPAVWANYLSIQGESAVPFISVLEQRGLDLGDFPGISRLDITSDQLGVQLSGGPKGGGSDHGDESHRVSGAAGRPIQGGDLEPPAGGVDLRSGAGGSVPVRHRVPGPVTDHRPEDGGTPGSGSPEDGAPKRGDSAADSRRGAAAGPEVRPPALIGDEAAAVCKESSDLKETDISNTGDVAPSAPEERQAGSGAPSDRSPVGGEQQVPGNRVTSPSPDGDLSVPSIDEPASPRPAPSGSPVVGRTGNSGPGVGDEDSSPELAGTSQAPSASESPQSPDIPTDDELRADLDPALRLGETEETAAHRMVTAAGELDVRTMLRIYDELGDVPPTLDVVSHDASYRSIGAHTVERHGPQIRLQRSTTDRTIEGRIYGDPPWTGPESWSYQWKDVPTMNRVINGLIRENWEDIRSELATTNFFKKSFYVGDVVGHGYHNQGMYGAGPRQSAYSVAAGVRLTIFLVPNSDPAELFVMTAFPTVMG
jgi:hypothetical protein